jgi:hypothetical protein
MFEASLVGAMHLQSTSEFNFQKLANMITRKYKNKVSALGAEILHKKIIGIVDFYGSIIYWFLA